MCSLKAPPPWGWESSPACSKKMYELNVITCSESLYNQNQYQNIPVWSIFYCPHRFNSFKMQGLSGTAAVSDMGTVHSQTISVVLPHWIFMCFMKCCCVWTNPNPNPNPGFIWKLHAYLSSAHKYSDSVLIPQLCFQKCCCVFWSVAASWPSGPL